MSSPAKVKILEEFNRRKKYREDVAEGSALAFVLTGEESKRELSLMANKEADVWEQALMYLRQIDF